MAELNARIIAKASATAGEVPQAADLEVAEVAVNTADGKFFTKHTDGTIKEISGSGGGGGGGAVDSVNGETGVVSLGIQDMDDYHQPFVYDFDSFLASQSPDEPGQWYLQQPGTGANRLAFAKEDANGAITSSIKDLPIGSSLWLNGVEFTTDTAGGSFSSSGSVGSWYVGITEDLSVVDTSGGLTITTEASIADGDILQWNDADQRFEPAQLPTAPVDSVNGETGAVSLGIQDMNDYQLNPAGGPRYIYTGDDSTAGGMEISGSSVSVNLVDQDGVNWATSWGDNTTAFPQGTVFSLLVNGVQIDGFTKTNTSYTTGVYSTFRVSPLLSDLLVDGDEVEFLINTFPLPLAPLIEGDILQWNDNTQKFNPAQPVERIQDQKDFEPNPNSPEYAGLDYRMPTGSNTDADNTPGGWYLADNRYLTFNAVGYAMLSRLSVNDALTMKLAGEADFSTTITLGVTAFSNSYYLRVADVPPSAYLNVAEGTPLILSSPLFAAGYLPLADGDILQWNDADQKFRPAQLPVQPVAVVESINGKTGVVSLDIQDMDDFEMKKPTVAKRIWKEVTLNSNSSYYNDKGEAAIFLSGERCIVNETDSDWEDFSGLAAAAVADNGSNTNVTFYVSRDGGTSWQEHVSGTVSLDHAGVATFFETITPVLDFTTDDLLISFDDPGLDVPLAQGNALRWNSASSKFNPESLTIQGMDDFEPLFSSPTVLRYDNLSDGGDYTTSGNAAVFLSDNSRLYAAQYDSNGVDGVAATVEAVNRWGGGILELPVWLSADGVNWVAAYSSFVSTTSVSFNALFKVSDGSPLDILNEVTAVGPIYFTMDDPAGSEIPLANDDILRWNSANQKFQPTSDFISLTDLKAEVAASADFADFQARIAAL